MLLLVILFFAVVRWRLRDIALERDEGEYAYCGQLILQGIPPYQLAYNMKLPGTYVGYAAMMTLFGETSSGMHIGLLLMNAATSLLIFLLARKLFGTAAGAFAGMCYALASASPSVLGFAAHSENFVVFAAVAGILLLIHAMERDNIPLLFGAGTCLGLAFLMKQPGAVFAVFALFYFLYNNRQSLTWEYAFPRVGALLAGIVWPFALTCLVLYSAGVFRNFWFWTFSYASTYGSEVSFVETITLFKNAVRYILPTGWPICALAILGLVALFRDPRAAERRSFVVGLLILSGIGVSAGFYFRNHYFVLLLPVVSLLVGLALGSIPEFLDRWPSIRTVAQPVARWVPLAVFSVVLITAVVQQRQLFFAGNAIVASNRLYPDNPFLAAREVAKYVESASSPETRIAVFGSEPEIYFYSHRHSATGYIYTYGLVESQQYAVQMQQEMIQEITRVQPEFVVFVDDELSWLVKPGAPQETFFNWIQSYINGSYTKAAQVDVGGDAGHLLGNMPRIYVFRRSSH
jgi:4-amino-4-deoxy-L-arabinose transferase-like glycosyltransferase